MILYMFNYLLIELSLMKIGPLLVELLNFKLSSLTTQTVGKHDFLNLS